MSELLQIINFNSVNIVEESQVDVDLVKAQKNATLQNVHNFSANDYFRIGEGEQAEIAQVDTISGQVITAKANFTFDHKRFEKVVKLLANQIKVYRAANVDGTLPSDINFSVISTLDIDADQVYTSCYDSTGGILYWYKYTYYNSTTPYETPLADSEAVRGGQYGHYVSIDDAKKEAGLQDNQYIDDTQIDIRRNQAEAEINTTLKAAGYTLPLRDNNGDEFVPSIVENIARLLTAGYILIQDYGPQQGGTQSTDGKDKLKTANDILTKIMNDGVILMDSSFNQLPRKQRVFGYPDDTTAVSGTNGLPEARMFPIDKKY